MGLDLTMGAVILIAALRGWIKGFVNQAVRIGGCIASVFTWPIRSGTRRGRTFWQGCPRSTLCFWTGFSGGSRPSPLTSFWSD